MSYAEKNTWAFGIIAIAAYATYLGIVVPMLAGRDPGDVPYQWPMLGTIGGAIVAGIVAGIVIGILSPRDGGKEDQRDREIHRFGDYVGQAFIVIGGVLGLLLAMLSAPHFWIANAIYLGFVLSAILSTIAKLAAYRRGMHPW